MGRIHDIHNSIYSFIVCVRKVMKKMKLRIKWRKSVFSLDKPSNYYCSRFARTMKYLGFISWFQFFSIYSLKLIAYSGITSLMWSTILQKYIAKQLFTPNNKIKYTIERKTSKVLYLISHNKSSRHRRRLVLYVIT